MKKYIIACLLSLGCSVNVSEPNTAVQQRTAQGSGRAAVESQSTSGQDNFDTIGHACADGSRWVWNHGKRVYEALSSEEAKQKYSNALSATKEKASELYDNALKFYHEHQDKTEDSQKSE